MEETLNHAPKSKLHAVCIPFPAQGHINPMLKLAKLLHSKGFNITFVNTEFNHKRLLKSRALDGGLPSSFRIETIPDGLPPSNADATQDVPSLCKSSRDYCLTPFRDLVKRLNNMPDCPQVTCIVSDGIMSFTLNVSEELGIPNVLFWTTSACGLMGYVHYRSLVEKGYTPLKDESYLTNGYLDTIIDWIPGMEGISLKDLPTFIRSTGTDESDPIYMVKKFAIQEVERIPKASALILNTFDSLENHVVQSLSAMFPAVYTLGPLHLFLKQIQQKDQYVKSIGSNLWKEDPSCLKWLDSKEKNSVIYVNFGSVTVMSPEQLNEFAWGLADSKHSFLWIIRPDLVMGESAILSQDFLTETQERGFLASWCPQEEVLNHPSVGGFLTHCGWNSTFESITAGVPMLCWPFFAEQQTNCWYVCTHLGIGMEINSSAKREVIEQLLRELIMGEKGKEMKNKALKWQKLAKEAVSSPYGSSYQNFEKLISCMLMPTASTSC
nr:UDP-glycosyltransferase [Petunia x hybrida]